MVRKHYLLTAVSGSGHSWHNWGLSLRWFSDKKKKKKGTLVLDSIWRDTVQCVTAFTYSSHTHLHAKDFATSNEEAWTSFLPLQTLWRQALGGMAHQLSARAARLEVRRLWHNVIPTDLCSPAAAFCRGKGSEKSGPACPCEDDYIGASQLSFWAALKQGSWWCIKCHWESEDDLRK